MRKSETDRLVVAAMVSAGGMIAFQVGGKATRDALFLTNFPVTALPSVLVASAAVSILSVLVASRLMSASGPRAVITSAFAVSSLLLLGEWIAYDRAPKVIAAVLYLHMAGFGAILVSGFWSIISELFDPRTAKAKVGRIVAASTLGGLVGGVLAERTGAMFSVSAMLPVLAALHLVCSLLNLRLRSTSGIRPPSRAEEQGRPPKSGLHVLKAEPYLKLLALLILLATVSETLLDYVLKAEASGTLRQSQQLIRFFALFYTGISLVTFLVQAALSRFSLQQFGLTTTMATMPVMVVAGGLGSLIWPGLFSTGFVRGGQAVLRSSLFRSGYELLYSPVPPVEKRAAKTIVDVAFDKFGDAIGAGVIRLVLLVSLSALVSNRLLVFIAVILGVGSLVLTFRLNTGYIATLEKSLLNQGADLALIDVEERTTRSTLLRTLGTVDLGALPRLNQASEKPSTSGANENEQEPLMKRLLDLQSERASVVRAALESQGALDFLVVPSVIRLLARDDVSEDALKALRTTVHATIGQLTDALLNTDEDFAIRRRIPRVLAYCPTSRAVDGLMRGLADPRFEVRFSCGRGLSRICMTDPALAPHPEGIYSATVQEVVTARRLADAPRVLDRYEDRVESAPVDIVWNSTNIRLEHIFRLLSLCLPPAPLHVAFQALHTNDAYLRGTALEYLESILPKGIRETLLQFLEGSWRAATSSRPADQIAGELMRSRQEIKLKVTGLTAS